MKSGFINYFIFSLSICIYLITRPLILFFYNNTYNKSTEIALMEVLDG